MKDFLAWIAAVLVIFLIGLIFIAAGGSSNCPNGQNNSGSWASGC